MGRRFFAIGCWVLIVTALVHMLGHYGMMNAQGHDDAERQLLGLMRSHTSDMGWGFVRSMMDIVAGFSLTFAVRSAGMGLLGLVLSKHARRAPGLLKQVGVVYAGTYGVMTAIGFRYFFPAPLLFLGATFLCFVMAVATLGGQTADH